MGNTVIGMEDPSSARYEASGLFDVIDNHPGCFGVAAGFCEISAIASGHRRVT